MPPRNASREARIHVLDGKKCLKVKSLFRNVVFTVIVFFLQPYRGHKRKFFSSPFFFTRFFWYLLLFTFCFIVFETIQIVQIVQLILWYKSNTSYAEAQVLTIVNVVIVEWSLEFCTRFELCFPVRD